MKHESPFSRKMSKIHIYGEVGEDSSPDSLKPAHIPTLLELLLLGAKDRIVEVSTFYLGKSIGRSQQAASKHLLDLEKMGYIERRRSGQKSGVKLTKKGVDALAYIHSILKSALEVSAPTFELKGYLFSGIGEGAYYVSLRGYRRQFIKKLGFDPYPGTLNLKLASPAYIELRRELKHYPGIRIEGFEDQHRTFGWVECLPAEVNESVRGMVLSNCERSHYDDSVIEVIAPSKIRDILGLKDGDLLTVKIYSSRQEYSLD